MAEAWLRFWRMAPGWNVIFHHFSGSGDEIGYWIVVFFTSGDESVEGNSGSAFSVDSHFAHLNSVHKKPFATNGCEG
ncbi:hypothetical protein [Paenibacillus roseipurpureus]|uniref:Uncharacterized protein n=1 Tax=Paenibacillus roseopurpureus TaxID=2918901 RepID=A0AA96LLC0_9BACL|nr:hypothetical protein [Paenibacillus sp. MBLB1832]WNR43997.1 hypothetical protein MJB10_23350 [Paenibacillus sp. MBLB1832]